MDLLESRDASGRYVLGLLYPIVGYAGVNKSEFTEFRMRCMMLMVDNACVRGSPRFQPVL